MTDLSIFLLKEVVDVPSKMDLNKKGNRKKAEINESASKLPHRWQKELF